MTRLVVWLSFIIILDFVFTLPRTGLKGKEQKKLEHGTNVGKSFKRNGENKEGEEKSLQNEEQNPEEEQESIGDVDLQQNEDSAHANEPSENNDNDPDVHDNPSEINNDNNDSHAFDNKARDRNQHDAEEINEEDFEEDAGVDAEEINDEGAAEEDAEEDAEEGAEENAKEIKDEEAAEEDAEEDAEENAEEDAEEINDEEAAEVNAEGKNENDPEENNREDSEKNKEENVQGVSRRPLRFGDILTPQDLLPITTKFLLKVESPGEGKGIVSSAKSPEMLADRIFQSFFSTTKRIMNLTDFDISGLDALQALALSGDVVDDSNAPISEETSKSKLYLNLNGQRVDINKSHRSCKYTLITKLYIMHDVKGKRKIGRRRPILEMRKYPLKTKKSRNLLNKKNKRKQFTPLGSQLKSEKSKGGNTNGSNKYPLKSILTTTSTDLVRHISHTERGRTADRLGRWRYECKDPADLDTCNIKVKYTERGDNKKSSHKEDEHADIFKNFRKMMKLSLIDEEVEKIIESRIMRLKPQKQDKNEKIETLNEYFNNIIMNEQNGMTTPMTNSEDGNMLQVAAHELKQLFKNSEQETVEGDPKGRRILGIPSIPTPRPYKNKIYLK